MTDWPNETMPGYQEQEPSTDEYQKSECVLGYIPIIYYSILLCVGFPGHPDALLLTTVFLLVNILTLVALSRLIARTQKALYVYLMALTSSDLLSQLFIIFVGFLLETAVFHREVPIFLLRSVSALEFAANHASIWATVPLTVDRYVALCHPLRHRQISYPARAWRIVAAVQTLALASGLPFFWWSDMWRVSRPPNAVDFALVWAHVTIIYFLPCSIFLVLNSLIVLRLRRRQHRCQEERRQQQLAPAGRLGKTTAMLLAITSVFAVLWAPRTAVVLYHLYAESVHNNWRVHLAYDLANMLAMLNTAVNFFLYCFVSKRFRGVVKDVLLLKGPSLHPQRSCHRRQASANASNSSLTSGAIRSQRHVNISWYSP